jgi:hypothetical protein
MIAAGSRLTNNAVRAGQIKARDGPNVRQFLRQSCMKRAGFDRIPPESIPHW